MNMHPVLNGLFLGKCVAEGDYLGALPYVSDIVNAVKKAAPGLIRETASKQLARIQNKIAPVAPAAPQVPAIVDTAAMVPSQGAANPYVKWILPAVITLGGLYLIRRNSRRR